MRSLNGFYDLVGNKPQEPGTIATMAAYLSQQAMPTQVDAALDRCVRECRYPVRLPDITQRIVGLEVPRIEAEMRAAWDLLVQFVAKYVRNDEHGNFGPDFGSYGPRYVGRDEHGDEEYSVATYPKLEPRILDCVRRTGGWEVYACMATEDFPFQQKRFFDEFQAWTSVESVAHDDDFAKLAAHVPALRLVAKPMDSPKVEKPATEDELHEMMLALNKKLGLDKRCIGARLRRGNANG